MLASTLVFVTNSRSSMLSAPRSALVAWIAAIATTPLAIALIALVDLFQPGR